MSRKARYTLTLALLVLTLIQVSGTLVESVYILDLMHTSLDIRAAGVLFFFAPLLWLGMRRWPARWVIGALAMVLAGARAVTPFLPTGGRLFSSGLATAAGWMLFVWFLNAVTPPDPLAPGRGLALGVGLSVALRTANFGVDFSLMPYGGWLGAVLVVGMLFLGRDLPLRTAPTAAAPAPGMKAAGFGAVSVIALAWFAFSAPATIARWTYGPYALIVALVGLGCVLWGEFAPRFPLHGRALGKRNLAFGLLLVLTILAQRVTFPATPNAPAVVVTPQTWGRWGVWALLLMLLTWPVLMDDLALFAARLSAGALSPRAAVGGVLWGLLFTVGLVFVQVFTNVWGYVAPVSTPFRNQFWLPYAALAGALTATVWRLTAAAQTGRAALPTWLERGAGSLVVAGMLVGFLRVVTPVPSLTMPSSLRVMTFNIQAGNNQAGERDFDGQLALIRRLQPDILALQESDTPRLSLNNNDLVRYFADQLGYEVFYGPPTVAGTFGTALLSRFPILNAQVVYTYSDQDEIGTTVAEVAVGERQVTVFNVHPDGSDVAMLVFADTLVAQADGRSPLIILGDFNLREGDPAYETIAAYWQNAWLARYPTGISDAGLDMSGRRRIDHIFVDEAFTVLQAGYVLPPESHSDHPAHWAVLGWR